MCGTRCEGRVYVGKGRTISKLFGVDGVLGEGVEFCGREAVNCGCRVVGS